jgi:hypothetical protein
VQAAFDPVRKFRLANSMSVMRTGNVPIHMSDSQGRRYGVPVLSL